MFALCAQHATRKTASHFPQPCIQGRIQGRPYSDWTGTEFPKQTQIFVKKLGGGELRTSSALAHKGLYEEVEQFRKRFDETMARFEHLQQKPLNPEMSDAYWRECSAEFIRRREFELGMEFFAASKNAEELKELFQREVVIIQAHYQMMPILHEVMKMVPPPGAFASEVEVRKPILAEDVSSELVQTAERALQTAFQKVLSEIEKASKTPIEKKKKELLWQIVSRERLNILKDQILFDVERIQDEEDPVTLRADLSDKVSRRLFIESEKTNELERNVKRLWQVADENPPASEFFYPFRVL